MLSLEIFKHLVRSLSFLRLPTHSFACVELCNAKLILWVQISSSLVEDGVAGQKAAAGQESNLRLAAAWQVRPASAMSL